MKLIPALLLTLSMAASRPPTKRVGQPAVTRITDRDFAYLLVQARIEAESPFSYKLPPGSHYEYRILGFTQQGNCVNGCPPSTIYVAISDYLDYRDGRIRAFRIEGLRFYSFAGVKSYRPTVAAGTFLTFRVYSNPDPEKRALYEVQVSQDTCTVNKLTEERWKDDGTWVVMWRRDKKGQP